MSAKLTSLILEPVFLRVITTLIKYALNTYTTNASHRREHPPPLPTRATTTTTSTPSGNTYGLFAFNNSSNGTPVAQSHVVAEEPEDRREDDVTVLNILIGLALPALSYFAAGVAFMTGILLVLWALRWTLDLNSQPPQTSPSPPVTSLHPPQLNSEYSNASFRHPADSQYTDTQLALLASNFPHLDTQVLSDVLLSNGCCVEVAEEFLNEAAAF